MNREEAFEYYQTTFADPKQSVRATTSAKAIFWEGILFAWGLIIIGILAIFMGNDKNKISAMLMVLWIVSRISSIITLAILFVRVNDSWKVCVLNQSTLTYLEPFYTAALQCADPLTIINLPKAENYFDNASMNIYKSWWFSLGTLFMVLVEPILALCVLFLAIMKEGCCCCCCERDKQIYEMYGSDSEGLVLQSRDSMINAKDDQFQRA